VLGQWGGSHVHWWGLHGRLLVQSRG